MICQTLKKIHLAALSVLGNNDAQSHKLMISKDIIKNCFPQQIHYLKKHLCKTQNKKIMKILGLEVLRTRG